MEPKSRQCRRLMGVQPGRGLVGPQAPLLLSPTSDALLLPCVGPPRPPPNSSRYPPSD